MLSLSASDIYVNAIRNKNAILSSVHAGNDDESEDDEDTDECYLTVSAPVNHTGVHNSTPGILFRTTIVPFREYIIHCNGVKHNDCVGTPFLYAGTESTNLIGRTATLHTSGEDNPFATARFTINDPNMKDIYVGVLIGGTSSGDSYDIYKFALNEVVGMDDTFVNGNLGLGYTTIKMSDGEGTNARNIAIGDFTLGYGTNVVDCVGVGYRSMAALKSGNSNIAIGSYALEKIGSDCYDVIAIGTGALSNVVGVSDSYNTGVGSYTMNVMESGANNVAVGDYTLYDGFGDNLVTLNANTVLGSQAMCHLFTTDLEGSYTNNTALGAYSMEFVVDSNDNTAVGISSIRFCNGNGNTAIGANSLLVSDITEFYYRNYNTALGYNSVIHAQSDVDYNVVIGAQSQLVVSDCAIGNTLLGANTTLTNCNYSATIGHGSGVDVTSDHTICLGTASDTVIVPNKIDAKYVFQNHYLLVPTGAIFPFAGSSSPHGYLLCDGSSYDPSVYPELFAIIGYQYNSDEGWFRVPDMRGRMIMGLNSGTFNSLGLIGGAETHTLSTSEMPSHAHSYNLTTVGYDNHGINLAGSYNVVTNDGLSGQTTGYTGGAQPHTIMNPYFVLNYIIKW